jgi:hypothetical protein
MENFFRSYTLAYSMPKTPSLQLQVLQQMLDSL